MPPRLAALDLADDPAAWRRAGFSVDVDGACRVGAVRLWLRPGEAAEAGADPVRSWVLTGTGEVDDVDGLATAVADESPVQPAEHPNGVDRLDHLVVATPDLERTVGALAAVGVEVRRTRDVPADERGGTPRRQAFAWLGDVILEVAGPAEPAGDGPARFWGLAFACRDLDAAAALLGDDLGPARPAVQPGRRIATLRRSTGVRTPVALLSAHPSSEG